MSEQQHDGPMTPAEHMAMPGAPATAGSEGAQMDDPMGMMTPGRHQLVLIGLVDPGSLEPHPCAEALPPMRDGQFVGLKQSIKLDGLQNPVILFQGKILDGRNRCRACRELGIPVLAFEFVGSEQRALIYVLSANQHRRDLTPSQRAVVAVEVMPRIAEDVNLERIEKLRRTLAREADGECLELLPNTGECDEPRVSSRVIAADMMGVSDRYVALAKRVRDASPELFEEVRAGEVTLPEAIRRLDGVTDDPRAVRVKAVRRPLNKLLRDAESPPAFLDRLEALVAEFADS